MGNEGPKSIQIVQNQTSKDKKNELFIDEVSCKGESLYRIQQDDRKNNPHMLAICALTFNRKGYASLGKGTAFLISPDLALTNAHNLFHQESKNYHTNLKLYPGVHGKLQNQILIQSYELPLEFTRSQGYKYQYDYALLKLNRIPSNINEKNILTLGKNFSDVNATLEVFGYPDFSYSTKNMEGTQIHVNLHGLKKEKRIQKINRQLQRIMYEISTQAGQSGSPMITMVNGKPLVIGIHSGGISQQQVNAGRLISNDMLDDINKWANKMKGSRFQVVNLNNFDLDWSKSTPFVNHFEVKGKALKRIPVNDETAFEYYQIVSQNCLPVTGTFEMNFRVIKYGESFSFITFGVILAGRKDMKDSGGEGETHRGSLGYQTGAFKYGNIFIDGDILANFQQQIYIPQGQTLKMEINRSKNTVTFTNNAKQKSITFDLPNSFIGKDIMPFVSMSDPGDYAEFVQ